MAQNLDLAYREAILCYSNLESKLKNLVLHEILENLNACSNKIDHILNIEVLENNIYFLALLNLKQQIQINISQITTYTRQNTVIKTTLQVGNSQQKLKDNENFKLRNTVKDSIVKPKTKGLCDIAGLENVKNILKTFIISPINQPQLYDGLYFSNCLLFFGPPGTGKTKLADAIAVEAGATLLSITPSTILSQYVGQSEKMLRSLFQYVQENNTQTILFFDEIDGLCRHRTQNENEHTRRLKTEFMSQISNFENSRKGFLICATNCPWELDIAFLRRFQKRIYVPLPNVDERYNLLKLYTKNTPLENTSDLWKPILTRTHGFSGYDMMQLIQHALTIPIIELQQNKVWKLVNNEFYEPFSSHDNFAGPWTIHFHDFENLPPKSVRSRKAGIEDLITALNDVQRTISDDDIKKYEIYINKYTKNELTT